MGRPMDTNMLYVPPSVSNGILLVEKKIRSLKSSDFVNAQLYKPSSHLLRRKGKYLRPALVLLSAHSIGADPKKYVNLAIAAELLHTSSLVHDDIIDKDSRRRGSPSVHSKYGIEAAILGGDALISKAIQFSSAYGKEVMDSMAKAALEMCAGEILDYSFQDRSSVPNVNDYLEIARLKSASLIGASCSAVPLHRKSRESAQLYRFGVNFGIAFQIRDDISDFKVARRPKDYKPNIVASLSEQSGIPAKEAAAEAELLLSMYIKKGLSVIRDKKAKESFSRYSKLLFSY